MMMLLQQLSESLQLLCSGTHSSYGIGSKGNTKDQEKALHSGCIYKLLVPHKTRGGSFIALLLCR